MTGSLEDSIAQLLVRADEFVYLTRETAMEADEDPFAVPVAALVEDLAAALRAAAVVPAEPATHDTPRWTMGAGDVIYGDDGDSSIECKQGSYRNAGLAQDVLALLNAADAAVAAVDGEAPAP